MINEERLKLMTDISLYRKSEQKQLRDAETFYRVDYVTKHMLQNLFLYTICYVCILALVLLCTLDDLLNTYELVSLVNIFIDYIMYYFIGLAIFEVITFGIYEVRYSVAEKSLRSYLSRLRRLARKQENA